MAKRWIADCITCLDDVPATTLAGGVQVVQASDFDAQEESLDKLIDLHVELVVKKGQLATRAAVLESRLMEDRAVMQRMEEALDKARDRLSEQEHPELFASFNELLKAYDASLGRE